MIFVAGDRVSTILQAAGFSYPQYAYSGFGFEAFLGPSKRAVGHGRK
jgi:hypothetical protein